MMFYFCFPKALVIGDEDTESKPAATPKNSRKRNKDGSAGSMKKRRTPE